MKRMALAVTMTAACGLSIPAAGQIVITPPDLTAGEEYRLALHLNDVITTQGHFDLRTTAVETGIDFYNDHVLQSLIFFPELQPFEWRALGSTATVDARDNTQTNPTNGQHASVPIYSMIGVRVADGNADLWDGTTQSFIVDPYELVEDSQEIFTGTDTDGTRDSSDFYLGSPSGRVTFGYMAERTDAGWVSFDDANDTALYGLAAISEVITVGEIFDDGFESGGTTAWSSTNP